jgi:hypothetical protein
MCLVFLLCPVFLLAQASAAAPEMADVNQRITELEKQLQQLKEELASLKQARQAAPAPAAPAPQAANALTASVQAPAVAQAPATAPAAAAPAPGPLDGIASVLKGATINGLIDIYYGYNFNSPSNHISGLRLFDQRANEFALNLIELGLVKTPDSSSRLGYNFTLGFGDAMQIVNAADPTFMQYLKEAYLSYMAPVGKGLQIDFGKFVTPAGAEVIESNANMNYSRSLLFNYAVPFYHFGGRAKYAFNDKYSLTGYLVNGWNDIVHDSNPLNNSINGNPQNALFPIPNHYTDSGKTGGLSFAWTPTKKVSLTETWFGGPGAVPSDLGNWRNLSDTVLTYTPTAKLTLTGNGDYGRVQFSKAQGNPKDWAGVAGYAKYQFNPLYALAARLEYFNDHTGYTTGVGQHVFEFTGTAERKFVRHLIARLEYRVDDSDKNFFNRGASRMASTQQTVMGGLIFVLEPDATGK